MKRKLTLAARKFPIREVIGLEDKSKDFIDDATMEHVRHNLFLLSSVEGMNGPSSAITFHSNVIGRKMDNFGKVHLLLHWSPEDMLASRFLDPSIRDGLQPRKNHSSLKTTSECASAPLHGTPSQDVFLATTGKTQEEMKSSKFHAKHKKRLNKRLDPQDPR
ncbi:hypothetical protein JTE90_008474 [Oedothorax gibbosus]|uniref:AEBP2-like C-terminal SH3 domain-containing protein n=1 Tax=Oedothorax gibbosus TaxID=931172 RepID=A0AAV6V0Y3_9ARAC|nr:hypothetical protein JTE90_008474 [Oedothorax gibbosus]